MLLSLSPHCHRPPLMAALHSRLLYCSRRTQPVACINHPQPSTRTVFIIRPIVASDVRRLAVIEQQCAQLGSAGWSSSDIEAELINSLSRAAVAADSSTDEPLGYIACWLVAGELQVLECAVDPEHQSKGIGSALLQHMLHTHSAPQGAVLEVKAHNKRAMRLYMRHGFVEVGRRPRFYADGSDAVLMARAAPNTA